MDSPPLANSDRPFCSLREFEFPATKSNVRLNILGNARFALVPLPS
jgi:hypothetical protein